MQQWLNSLPALTLRLLQGILAALTRWRRFVLRTSTATSPQCHPMPWERLINICIQVILVPNPPFLPCHLFCLGIASSGWDSEEAAGQTESSAWKLPPKVFQRPAILKIDNNFFHLRFLPSQWSASLRLRALCHWFLGSRQTPQVHRNMTRPGLNAYCDVFLQDPC